MPQYLEVVFPLPLDHTFTYLLPEDLEQDVSVGHRVLVPFKHRTMTGYVVGAAKPPTDFEAKKVKAVLDDIPLLTPVLLGMAKYMCDLYGCALGEAIQTVLPGGLIKQSRRKIFAAEKAAPTLPGKGSEGPAASESFLGPESLALLSRLEKSKGLDFVSFVRKEPKALPLLRDMEKRGLIRIESVLSSGKAVEQQDTYYAWIEGAEEPRSAKQKRVRELLASSEEPVPRSVFLKEGLASALSALNKKNAVRPVLKPRTYATSTSFASAPEVVLSEDQAAALSKISAALERAQAQEGLDAPNGNMFLLHGVTGSGKTEVYLQAAAKALALGQTVLALVPEIALTPQFVGRFRARFGERISVLHSARSESERLTEWKRIRKKEVEIVIGPRSAIFAPLENLGLMIVDEEHDASYKQEDGLCYHVKHLVHYRAHAQRAAVIFGSATPSMESYELARQGKLEKLALPGRVGHFGLPEVELVDLRTSFSKFGEKGLLSETLRDALQSVLGRNEQAVLFLNRRGFAPLVLCPSCGEFVGCPNCSVSMTFHQEKYALVCHYCDAEEKAFAPCRHCGHLHLVRLGMGTEKIEDELRFYFPDASIARMDRDTVGGKGAHEKILSDFAKGKTDILLGTQMVTKGLDVENVTLVGVLLADQSLHFPDFRAAETTFQLLTQVAGRAGRGQKKGRAIFQTFLPQHYAIATAVTQDYDGFFNRERTFREALGYPPFSSISLLELSSETESDVTTASVWLRKQAEKAMALKPALDINLLGPAPCPIKKIQKRYRYHMMVRSPRGGVSAKFSKWLASQAREHLRSAGVELSLNIDPYRFM